MALARPTTEETIKNVPTGFVDRLASEPITDLHQAEKFVSEDAVGD